MERPSWSPETVDIDRPSQARIYDYYLGGSHNFSIDREMARRSFEVMPDIAVQAQANRAFLHRAVRYLLDAGIRQFLDIGSGIPTLGNVHEVAQRYAPDARVVYVDIDPVAVAHSRQILDDTKGAVAIQEDLRNPDTILAHPELRGLLDFHQPIGLLLLAILHVIPDEDDPAGIVARLRDGLPSGSYLAVSHATDESLPELWVRLVELSRKTPIPITPRSRAEVEAFFAGFELVPPGLVWGPEWHPESPEDVGDDPGRSMNYVGVGRKP
jgi:S-adenosyl methyltransferase